MNTGQTWSPYTIVHHLAAFTESSQAARELWRNFLLNSWGTVISGYLTIYIHICEYKNQMLGICIQQEFVWELP